MKECEAFAQANSIPFPKRRQRWSHYLSEWKKQRRERGLSIPAGPPPKSERPDYSQSLGESREEERRRRHRAGRFDEAVDWVARYLAQLKPGETASQRSYGIWAATQEGAIYPSSIQTNHGGWIKVRDAARERLTAKAPEAAPALEGRRELVSANDDIAKARVALGQAIREVRERH
jgi:hypothetical protein